MMKSAVLGVALAIGAVASSGSAPVFAITKASAAQSGFEKFAADVTIMQAFDNALRRSPDDRELRRYRARIFEDHWTQRDIEDDLGQRHDYWSHNDRLQRDRDRGGYDVDRMIRHAYQDVLGREPDSAGLRTYRSNVIDRGWTERQVREALRDSPEHRANASSAADRIVTDAYRHVLGRDPDVNGLYNYRNQVEHHGWDEHDVEDSLRNSPEYRAKNATTPEQAREIVRRAYLSVLGREPDAGSAGYVDQVLRNHWTEQQVARELRNSEEYRKRPR